MVMLPLLGEGSTRGSFPERTFQLTNQGSGQRYSQQSHLRYGYASPHLLANIYSSPSGRWGQPR